MTICTGWRDAGDVFIIADTLRTYSGRSTPPSLRPDATFEEPTTTEERRSEEAANKVVSLAPGVIAGLAGAISPATSTLVAIRNELRYGRSLREIMAATDKLISASSRFQVLIGGGPTEDPQLYVLHSDGRCVEVVEDRDPVILGSLSVEGKDFVRRTVLLHYEGSGFPLDAECALVSALMGLQAAGRRVNLIPDHAGGAFFGMRAVHGVTHFTPDILYSVFNKIDVTKGGVVEFALVGIRGGALVAWPANRPGAVMISDVNDLTRSEVRRLLDAKPLDFNVAPPFICLIDQGSGALIGIDSRKGTPSKYIELSSRPDGSTQLTLLAPTLARIEKMPDAIPPPAQVQHFFGREP